MSSAGQQQRTDDRSDDGGPAAEQAHAAEYDGCHGVEQERRVGGGLRRADPGDQQDRGESGGEAGDHVDGGLDPRGGNPCRGGCFTVAAGGQHVGAEAGVEQHDVRDDRQYHGENEGVAEDPDAAGRQLQQRDADDRLRFPVGDDQRHARRRGQRAEGDDEVGDLAAGDEQSVDEADRQARRDGGQYRREAGRTGTPPRTSRRRTSSPMRSRGRCPRSRPRTSDRSPARSGWPLPRTSTGGCPGSERSD